LDSGLAINYIKNSQRNKMANWKYILTGSLICIFAFFLHIPVKLIFGQEYLLLNYGMFAFIGFFLMFIGIVVLITGIVKDYGNIS